MASTRQQTHEVKSLLTRLPADLRKQLLKSMIEQSCEELTSQNNPCLRGVRRFRLHNGKIKDCTTHCTTTCPRWLVDSLKILPTTVNVRGEDCRVISVSIVFSVQNEDGSVGEVVFEKHSGSWWVISSVDVDVPGATAVRDDKGMAQTICEAMTNNGVGLSDPVLKIQISQPFSLRSIFSPRSSSKSFLSSPSSSKSSLSSPSSSKSVFSPHATIREAKEQNSVFFPKYPSGAWIGRNEWWLVTKSPKSTCVSLDFEKFILPLTPADSSPSRWREITRK